MCCCWLPSLAPAGQELGPQRNQQTQVAAEPDQEEWKGTIAGVCVCVCVCVCVHV